MIGTMVELDIGQPGVAILARGNRRVVFFLRCARKTVGSRHTIDVNPLSQAVDAFTVSQIGGAEFKISLRGGEGELAALGHPLRSQDKSIGHNRCTTATRGANEADVRMSRKM